MKKLLVIFFCSSLVTAAQDTYRIGPYGDRPVNIKIGVTKVGKIGSPGYAFSQTSFGYEASKELPLAMTGVATFGYRAGAANKSMSAITALGASALENATVGSMTVAVGSQTLRLAKYVNFSTAIGHDAMGSADSSYYDFAGGADALFYTKKSLFNVVIGAVAGMHIGKPFPSGSGNCTRLSSSVLLGAFTRPLTDNEENSIAIGFNSVTRGSNTTVIGNDATRLTEIKGALQISKLSAEQALIAEDATIVYVTTTDSIFTSTGFWGKENGRWIKL